MCHVWVQMIVSSISRHKKVLLAPINSFCNRYWFLFFSKRSSIFASEIVQLLIVNRNSCRIVKKKCYFEMNLFIMMIVKQDKWLLSLIVFSHSDFQNWPIYSHLFESRILGSTVSEHLWVRPDFIFLKRL